MITKSRAGRRAASFVAALALAASLLPLGPGHAHGEDLNLSGDNSVFLTETSGALAPGLDLTSFQRLQPGGWVTGHVMTADLTEPTLSLDVVDGGTVSGTGTTVSELARKAGAVAAVNGDYFDMNYSQAPVSSNVSSTEGVRTAISPGRDALTITNGLATIQRLASGSTVQVNGAPQSVDAVNSPSLGANQLGYFTPVWGSYDMSQKLGASEAFTALVVVDGKVTHVVKERAALRKLFPLADGRSLLLARGTAQARIAALTVGSPAPVTVRTSVDVDLAVSGANRLVTNGVATSAENVTAARTAVGINRDGTKLYVASIDGRLGDAHGMTITELTQFMLDLGAYNALNLDGGGSTTLVGRLPGDDDVSVIDRPSDGNERLVANALVFRTSAPATLSSLQVKPSIAGGNLVMPGLTRTIESTGLSTALGPVRTNGDFATSNGNATVQKFDGQHAILTAQAAGATSITYSAAGMAATTDLTVLGEVQRLEANTQLVSLVNSAQTADVKLIALDADNHRAPVETRDVTVEADGPVTVEATSLDTFRITPTSDTGSALVTFRAAGASVVVPVTIGTKPVTVADFADGAAWKMGTAQATGTITPTTGAQGEPALRLQYDFTKSTATRGFYAIPPTPLPIPGQPQKLTMMVNGDGNGSWLRLEVIKGDGVKTNLNGPNIDFTGWRQVTIEVPAGTPYPLTMTAIRFMETRSAVKYTGDLTISTLNALVPSDVAMPAPVALQDPVMVTNGTVDGRPQRIAVISDAQFVAAAPDSEIVAAARRTLREIVAAKPDHLFILGDFVDLGYPADIAFAKQVLDEEIGGKLPYTYVPGNHEMYGSNSTANFTAVFGPTHTVRDIEGTRFITLDSATGNLHPGGSTEQLQFLEAQLADARTNAAITGVVVMHHHPIDDPLDSRNSQLTDRYEAAALLRTLAAFRNESGKSIAEVSGNVGVFHGSVNEGVSMVINGNSGKSPASTPANGGYTGWTMLGIDPGQGLLPAVPTVQDRLEWFRAESHARVDELTLNAPTTMKPGQVVDVTASLVQDGGRVVPVSWPVAASWSGTNIQIKPSMDHAGAGSDLSPVLFDPERRELIAIGAGKATLTLTVNGVSRSVEITVDGGPALMPTSCSKKGTTITVSGSGFVPGAPVTATISENRYVLGTGIADAKGNVTMTGTTPKNWKKGVRTVELSTGGHVVSTVRFDLSSGNC